MLLADKGLLKQARVVLVRPQESGNLGAVCRAVKNTGLGAVRVVGGAADPQADAARNLAAKAQDVLRRVERAPTLPDAVADCVLVVATTRRAGRQRRPAIAPRAIAPDLLEALRGGPVALVFGPERTGLSAGELRCCHRVVTIPSSPDYPSLNLAQAVLILGYELMLAAGVHPAAAQPQRARAELLEILFAKLKSALLAVGFLHRDNPEHLHWALRQVLGRAALTETEAKILIGMATQIEWYVRQHPGPPYPGR
ncbi:MAG TPA: RNA methyltransferase [Acidobacteriota bacterium]